MPAVGFKFLASKQCLQQLSALQGPILCELASFAACWCIRGVTVARAFADMASEWVCGLEQELSDLSVDSSGFRKRLSLQLNCSMASMLVVLCFGYATTETLKHMGNFNYSPPLFSTSDTTCMLRHLALARYYVTCTSKGSGKTRSVQEDLWQHCLWIAARCSTALSDIIQASPSLKVLSDVALAVLRALPEDLRWKPCMEAAGCYTAVHTSSNGTATYYSVNILNGCILQNGSPPSCLPANILSHALYKHMFGCIDCDVTDDLCTQQPLAGRFYQFQLAQDQLIIREREVVGSQHEILELLPGVRFKTCSLLCTLHVLSVVVLPMHTWVIHGRRILTNGSI
jgi:hypothetical protein